LANVVSVALGSNPDLQNARGSRSNSLASLKIAGIKTNIELGTTSFFERSSYDKSRSSNIFGNISYENLYGTRA
jgi:hypothetical protein